MNARSQFAVRTLVAAISACFAGGVSAAPQAPTVVAGQAGFQQNGNTLTITNTPGAIINWQSFSINRDEVVRFLQQSASSQVLNRVTGIDPSVILGQLQSNGRVLLINPNGVLFGKGSQVDVAGLLVSTLQLKDADFLAGRYKFNDTPGAGSIDNQGTIRTQSGGHVILIAPKVENSGLIQSPEGHIMLAAGRSVTLADPDKPAIQIEVTNRDNTAVNLGTLIAKNVTLYGGIIRNSGLIQATTAVVGENGKIRLQAKYEVENTGTLQANGTQGGDILIQATEGVARVQGTVEARGSIPTAVAQATAKTDSVGKGGRIEILAPEILVDGTVDASGTTGGGAILIGGQYQGGNSPVPTDWAANPALQRASLSLDNPYATSPSVTASTTSSGDSAPISGSTEQNNPLLPNRKLPTARMTTIGANARIRADGLEEGDGGIIVAWSDEHANVQGALSARGGQIGGNGGLIETSGHTVTLSGIRVDASAPAGKTGKWLIDPVDFTIAATDGDITGAELSANLATADVEIQSANGAVGINGDINVNDAVSWNANRLTLSAYHDININAVMTATGTALLALSTGGGSSVSGAVRVGFDVSGAFLGRVDFDRSGTGFLSVNGVDYTVINTLADLQGVNDNLTGNYALGANINASDTIGWNGGQGFLPLGQGSAFAGNFDGLGHTVNQLTINRPSEVSVGLFSVIGVAQRVSNLGLTNANVTGLNDVGGLAGRNDGTVANSFVTGLVRGTDSVGGLVGFNDIFFSESYVEYSHSSATVSGSGYVGGLVGFNFESGHIRYSYANGNTLSTGGFAGGVAGSSQGEIFQSYSTGDVTGYAAAAGIAGHNSGTIRQAYSLSHIVSSNGSAGGLVGLNDGEISQSFSTGTVYGYEAGGAVGHNQGRGNIQNVYSSANVTGIDYAGGLVGYSDASVYFSFSLGSVTGDGYVGGFAGFLAGTEVANNASYASVSGSPGAYVGGFVGFDYTYGNISSNGNVWDSSKAPVGVGFGYYDLSLYPFPTVNTLQRFTKNGYANFDFADTWDIQPGETPTLLAFMPTNRFLGQIDNNWNNARNWSFGHTPLSGEGVVTYYDVNLSSGSPTVKRLYAQSYLSIAGASTQLTVTGDTVEETGQITVSNGAVMTVNGAMSLRNNASVAFSSGGRIDLGVGASLETNGFDYVLVRDVDQLQAINNDTSGHYALAVNIDANATSGWNSGAGFNPLGSSTWFTGTFEGLGHQISNLMINQPTMDGVGLFSQVDAGVIRNVSLVNASIVGRNNVGALIGEVRSGRVDNASVSGSVTGQNNVGGLIGALATGWPEATVQSSNSSVTVVGADNVGGLVGITWAGGYEATVGWVLNSYSTGTVTATAGIAGGLIGNNVVDLNHRGESNVINSYYNIDSALINGSKQVTEGGIYGAQFSDWLVQGRLLDIGRYLTQDANGYYQIGSLQNLKDALAFAGDASNSYRFRLTANLDLASSPGLNIPVLAGAELDGNGFVVRNFSISRANADNVGFIGELRGGEVYDLGVENVSVVGRNQVGGLVGFNRGGYISQSYSTGSVSGAENVGGLVGYHSDGYIYDSYSSTHITASNNGGGLVGWNRGQITTSFSNGNVSGSGSLGGLVGGGSSNVSYSYWDVEASGQANSTGGVGLTTAQTKQQSSFDGFDFNNVWEIDQGVAPPKPIIFTSPANTWVGGIDYLWSTAANWSLGHVPLSNERVSIPLLPDASVTFDLGSGVVKRLDSDAYFRIDGGSFTVNGNATFNYGLSLDIGSTLTVNGNLVLNTMPQLASGAKVNLGPLAGLSINGEAYTLLRDVAELQAMNGVGGRVALASDIDASATAGWSDAYGVGFVPLNCWTCDFEGLGHSISNLFINRPTQTYVGLFGDNQGQIRNVHLVNAQVVGADNVGSLAGWNNGLIAGSSSSGASVTGGLAVGGLVGRSFNQISDSTASDVLVTGNNGTGGLVGYNDGTVERSSTVRAQVIGSQGVGGLVGVNNNNSLIQDSYTDNATVSGVWGIGGLVGMNQGITQDSVATSALVTGEYAVGGLAGYSTYQIVGGQADLVTVSADREVGGLVGSAGGVIEGSWARSVSVTGNQSVGGLVGAGDQLNNSYYDIDSTLINGARAVTRYGIYGTQFQDWLNNGLSLNINNYLTADANGYFQVGSVQNLKDWLAFAELPGTKYRLTADLDLATLSGWNLPVFSGAEIDGAGHNLSHLSVSQPYNHSIGFIGNLLVGASLHDIGLVDAAVLGNWGVGALVGLNEGSVSRSYVAGAATSIQGNGDLGGLVGWNSGTLANAHYNVEQVQINGMRQVVTEGALYGSQFADWLAGGLSLNVANYLTTDANGYYQLGSVQNLKDMLGFVYQASAKFRLTNDIDLTTIPGWFIPVFRSAEFDGAGHVLSNLTVNQPFNADLGFVGHLPSGGLIRNLGIEGASVAGYGSIGALVGWNEGNIESTYSTGYVTSSNPMAGNSILGGLVGMNDGSISNSFSSATVDGAAEGVLAVGGLVGGNYLGTVTNSYASGVVSGAVNTGGLIGYNTGTVTAGAWNTDTSGQSQGVGQDYGTSSLIGMTSAQMANSANFAGWDFSGVWVVMGGVPRLLGVGQALTNTWTGLFDNHDWFAASNWSLGHVPTANEYVSIPDVAGTTQIDINSGQSFSVRSVTSAEFLSLAGAGTSFLLTNGGALNAGLRIGVGATLTASGNLIIGGGNSQIDSGASLISTTGMTLAAPASLAVDGALRAATLATPGTLALRDGSQVTIDSAWSHTGTLNVSGAVALSGPLDIDGGSVNLAAGADLSSSDSAVRWNAGTIAGAGSLTLQGAATLAIDALGSGARILAGPDVRVDSFDLAAGSVEVQQGRLLLPNGGSVASGTRLLASGGAVEITGQFNIAGDVVTQGSATLAAIAPVTVQAGGLLQSGGSSMSFAGDLVNNGMLDAVAGVTHLDGTGTYTHGGTFRSAPGATLVFGAGTHRFGDGSQFDLNGTLVNNGQFLLFGQNSGLTVAAGSSLDLAVANFSGNGVLTNQGTVSADGVAFSGRLVNEGAANLQNGTSLASGFYNTGILNVVSGTVTALGTTSELADGTIMLGSGATLEKSSGTLLWSGGTFGGSGTLAFTNGGLIGFSGNGDRVLDNANLNFSFANLSLPSGSLRLQSGSLNFNTTGGNSTLIPVGTELTMAGGTLTNNGPLDVSGLFGLYGGTLAGAGAINMTGGTIDLPANSTVNWTATGAMSNSGTLNLSNRTITNAITNNGTINTTGGLVFTQLFTNQGTFNLNSGTTTFSAGFQQNSGSTHLGTGAGTSANVVAGGSGFNLAGGTLSGSGSIAGDLNVGAAALSVGFSPGSLSITGNLNLAAGSVTNIELGGTAQGSGYDTITVTGTANLAGTLNVTSYGGYVPAAASSYNVMSFGSSVGAFGSTSLPAGWAMSMSSTSTYLQLLMAAAQAAGVSPLQALMQALAAASGTAGSAASDPGAATMGGTSLDFSRVTPNDLATSLMQQMMSVTQVIPSTDFEDLKVCQ